MQRLIYKTSVFLVMDFLEHDLKTLQEDMLEPFLPSEIKTLLLQLTSAVEYLHGNWILHRDLKTSNILMNNRGQIKIADFGMARYYGDPPPKLTQLVVTLWYRAPELLLGAEKYGAEVDMWSLGCILGELLTKEPLLQGKNEVDELSKVDCRVNLTESHGVLTVPSRYSSCAASPRKPHGQASSACPTPVHYDYPATIRKPRAPSSEQNSLSLLLLEQICSLLCSPSILRNAQRLPKCWPIHISKKIRNRRTRLCSLPFHQKRAKRREGRSLVLVHRNEARHPG